MLRLIGPDVSIPRASDCPIVYGVYRQPGGVVGQFGSRLSRVEAPGFVGEISPNLFLDCGAGRSDRPRGDLPGRRLRQGRAFRGLKPSGQGVGELGTAGQAVETASVSDNGKFRASRPLLISRVSFEGLAKKILRRPGHDAAGERCCAMRLRVVNSESSTHQYGGTWPASPTRR